jgi:hypothetical protein
VVHIGFPDPAAAEGDEEAQKELFRKVRDGIRQQVLDYLREWEEGPQQDMHFSL